MASKPLPAFYALARPCEFDGSNKSKPRLNVKLCTFNSPLSSHLSHTQNNKKTNSHNTTLAPNASPV